jgi:hypothetical protein
MADGRSGTAAWICILLFCHYETAPVSLLVVHTILSTQPYSAFILSSDEFRNFQVTTHVTPLFQLTWPPHFLTFFVETARQVSCASHIVEESRTLGCHAQRGKGSR